MKGWRTSLGASKRCRPVFDLPRKEAELKELDEQAAASDFWNEPQVAQKVMQRAADIRSQIDRWAGIGSHVADLQELAAIAADDEGMISELESELTALSKQLVQDEMELLLGGDYDDHNVIVSVYAREGGTEAQEWARMVMRMYVRWAERHRYDVEISDMSEGEEAGIKSATLTIKGRNAYGYLRGEAGQHRMVRISPYDSQHRRQTSFALVEVLPEIDNSINIDVRDEDLKIDVYRSAGAGGQNVQKTSTAIRITHLPSGTVVTCQNERSQLQNRETAMKILLSKLWEMERRKKEEETAGLRGEHVHVGWGTQIRCYVYQPYQQVKDLRTGYETSAIFNLVDGELDEVITSVLHWRADQAVAVD